MWWASVSIPSTLGVVTINAHLQIDLRLPAISQLFTWLIFVQRTQVSMTVIYRSQNVRSRVPVSFSSFILQDGLSCSEAQVEAVQSFNFIFQLCWKPLKWLISNIFVHLYSRHHWECMWTFSVGSHETVFEECMLNWTKNGANDKNCLSGEWLLLTPSKIF